MKTRNLRAPGVLALAVATFSTVPAAVVWPPGFDEETVAEGIDKPTAFAYAPDGRLFIAEKAGRVRIVGAAGELLATPFATVSVNTNNDRGLIGLAVDPDFLVNHYIYLAYTTDIVPAAPANALSRIHSLLLQPHPPRGQPGRTGVPRRGLAGSGGGVLLRGAGDQRLRTGQPGDRQPRLLDPRGRRQLTGASGSGRMSPSSKSCSGASELHDAERPREPAAEPSRPVQGHAGLIFHSREARRRTLGSEEEGLP